MKKVLFVATTAKSHINIFHRPHIKFFKENKWQVHVATNGDEKVIEADKEFSLAIYRNPFRLGNLLGILKLIRIMKKEKYNLVTCHTPMGGVVARIAACIAKTSPVVYVAHGFHFYKGAPATSCVYKFIEKMLARVTDAIVTMNEEDFQSAQKFKLRQPKIYKIPGIGLDTKKILSVQVANDKRKSLGIDKKSIVVTNVAEMIKRKNQATLLKAFAKINRDDVILVICGRGKLEKKLKRMAKKLGVANKVKFLGFRKDIAEILAVSDIFAFPSFQEGLPLAVMEAMAIGLPVVCSDVRGNNDLIFENENGFLVKPLDVSSFAEKIQLLCHDKLLREKIGVCNREKIFKYDLENVLQILRVIYDEMKN